MKEKGAAPSLQGPSGSSLSDAFAKLEEAMRPKTGGTTDPDRRRAAARLADLARSDDGELKRYAQRHLPGRAIGDDDLKALRELVVGIARLIALQGRAEGASELASTIRATLLGRIDELEQKAENASASSTASSAKAKERDKPAIAVPAAPPSPSPPIQLPSYAKSSAASANAGRPGIVAPKAPAPPRTIADPSTEPSPESAPIETSRMADPTTAESLPVPKKNPLPFAPSTGAAKPIRTADKPRDAAVPKQGAPTSAKRFGMTADMPSLADMDPALPFRGKDASRGKAEEAQRPLPAHLAHIDLEGHAVFCALLQVFPERHVQVCAQYGLRDPGDREALDRHWFGQMSANPPLGVQWMKRRNEAIAHYRASR